MMSKIRMAQKGDTVRQKEIWKRCFGDPDSYIEFYYANRYREDETAVLLQDGEISAMLTMISVRTVLPDNRSFNTAMLYAIATHPQYQNRGFATKLMDFSNRYLRGKEHAFSVLVPAKMQLFDYYRKQGYQDRFYVREALLLRDRVDCLPIYKLFNCTISSITPEEYNRRRNIQLRGRLFISYHDEDIAYQQRLSQQSGADIYALDIEDIQGCLTLERITSDRVFIKEILLPEDYIYTAIRLVIQQLSAKEYILRTPPYLGEKFGGSVRPFGMIRILREVGSVITSEDQGYLGFAFD